MRQLKIQKSITVRSDEALSSDLSEISKIPMITAEEESDLSREIQKGGKGAEKAKERLVMANLRFVVSVAKQYQHKGLTLTDLIDEGNIGLVKAAEKFDDTRGFKFISYAVWWIRQSIMQALAEQSRLVRLPLNQVSAIQKINNEIAKFEQVHLRKPSAEEIAELTELDIDKVDKAMNANNHEMSIDAPIGDDDENNSMVDILSSDFDSRADKEVDNQSLNAEVRAIMETTLKPREIDIICESYGIGRPQISPEEIGTKYGLSRERVRQIREKGLTKIRHSKYAKILAKYLG